MNPATVAVTSRSFSKNPILRQELLDRYPNTKFNDEGASLKGAALVNYLKGVKKAIVALETVDDELLSQLPELEVISKYGVGLNNIDFSAVKKNGIRFAWTGGTNKVAVAELALGVMLSLSRNLFLHNIELKSQSTWKNQVGQNIQEKTVGIVGLGHIGKVIASYLKVLGAKVIAHDILDMSEYASQNAIEMVSYEDLLSRSDVVTFHVPLDDSTRYMLSSKNLHSLKASALVVNTSRGGVIHEEDLLDHLRSNPTFKAFCDVFEDEPAGDHPLLRLPNFFASPHIGGSTEQSILAMGRAAIDGLDGNTFEL